MSKLQAVRPLPSLPRVLGEAFAAAAALLTAAAWVRLPSLPWLAACAVATLVAIVLAWTAPVGWWPRLTAGALTLFCVLAAFGLGALERATRDWPAFSEQTEQRSTRAMQEALARTGDDLQRLAQRALEVPAPDSDAFRALRDLVPSGKDESVVLFLDDTSRSPSAWAGVLRSPLDMRGDPMAVVRSPFYVTLQVMARAGSARAVATALVHADAPADRLSMPLDAEVAARTDVMGFEIVNPADAEAAAPDAVFAPTVSDTLLVMRPILPRQSAAVLRISERAQRRGALILALALALLLAGEWRPRRAAVPRRVAALVVVLGVLAIIPLSTFSNATHLFDPTYFFSTLGGLYTANVGALALAAGVALLAALAVARARTRIVPAVLGVVVAVALCIVAPFVILRLADGITPPGAGVPLVIWVGWQLALALVGTAMLVCAGALRRGIASGAGPSPLIAIALAGVATAAGPFVWQVPGRWPVWYVIPWCVAALGIVFARRTRWRVITPAVVAGLGAALVVWGTMAQKRLSLAERDVHGLGLADPDAEVLLERFATEASTAAPPASRAALLKLYAGSELAAANYPVALAIWQGDPAWQAPRAELALARFRSDEQAVIAAASLARQLDTAVLTEAVGSPGTQLILAVPLAPQTPTDVWTIITVVVAPQTRLIGESVVAPLLGLPVDTSVTPLYSVSLIEGDRGVSRIGGMSMSWVRTGSTLHSDWAVRTLDGPGRAHVEVELRSLDALTERAVLLLVVDLLVVGILWSLSAVGDGALWRWIRGRGWRWRSSYRTQLTVVLFTFFVAPTVVFTIWSERRLRADETQARTLRVTETLRSVAAENELGRLVTAEAQLGIPLLLYDQGVLSATSDTLYAEVAPLGLLLRPDIEQALGRGDEVVASRSAPLGQGRTLVGYRAANTDDGRHVVLAAPEAADEVMLERRSADLNILVLFATVVGATAAWWLSGRAARRLARPIDQLRRAALAMAAGEREPPLAGDPPLEFSPVFSAFRRMAADFGASQRVLAWGEMARQVAHEIKNPLTPIRLGIQHVLRARRATRPDFDAILEANAGRILNEIDRLDEIARAFSRYGTAPTERAPAESVNVAAVARDVVELERMGGSGASAAAASTAVVWELMCEADILMVMARAEELREVLLNILENARLAHAKRVAVRVEPPDRRSARVVVTVDDDGEGIPSDVLPRIFEPHFSTRTSGSGLGLAVSRRIVEGWGGGITVASERGRGTRVTISLLSVTS